MDRFTSERGQTMPLIAGALAVLLGFTAFAIDLGYLRHQQRAQQIAADSAAIAGAAQLQIDSSQVATTAQANAAQNGFTNDASPCVNTCVVANTPPVTGPYQGNRSAVEVIVTRTYPSFFSQFLGINANTVSARAVALVGPNNNGACIFVMHGQWNANSPHAATISPSCGAMVNGDVKSQNGSWNIPFISATGSVTATDSYPGAVLTSGIPLFNDPCPRVPGCNALSKIFTQSNPKGFYSTSTAQTPVPGSGSCSGTNAINPSYYTSFPNINDTVTLCPGTYLVDSGGTSANLVGTGVTIVMLGGGPENGLTSNLSAPPPAAGAQPITIDQNDGAPGVLYYDILGGTTPMNSTTQVLNGMMYFPNSHVNLNGHGSTLTTDFLVVGVLIGNQLTLTVPPNGGGAGLVQTPKLVE